MSKKKTEESELFSTFGKMDYAGVCRTAAGLRAEKDMESAGILAKENGIDKEDMADYMEGAMDDFTPFMVAEGRIAVETKGMRKQEIFEDWVEYLRMEAAENEEFAVRLTNPEKSVKGCIAELLVWSMKNMYPVDKEIIAAAGASGSVKLGIPGMATAKKLMRDYYSEVGS